MSGKSRATRISPNRETEREGGHVSEQFRTKTGLPKQFLNKTLKIAAKY
jgi:hypothetical protein